MTSTLRFGTDGIRGEANTELDALVAYRLGRAVASTLTPAATVLIGQDTRRSGDMLAAGFTAGATSLGADVVHVGTVPTPALAFLVPEAGAAAGVVVSASHNPASDNGLKVLDASGTKLDEAAEAELERRMAAEAGLGHPRNDELGRRLDGSPLVERYREHRLAIARSFRTDLPVLLDCANGAGGTVAPEVLAATGAALGVLFDTPDGTNINQLCGATAPEALADAVRRSGAALGFALDGDADRCVAIDERGEVVDGDQLIGLIALDLLRTGRGGDGTVVVSILSNGGLAAAIEAAGGRVERTPVGDRWIAARMAETGARLGGEKSGHVIVAEHASTGDGLLTALVALGVVVRSGRPLSELAAEVALFPQQQRSIPARHRDGWADDAPFRTALEQAERELPGGRVIVRPSGTEPVLRIMVEGPDGGAVATVADTLSRLASERLD